MAEEAGFSITDTMLKGKQRRSSREEEEQQGGGEGASRGGAAGASLREATLHNSLRVSLDFPALPVTSLVAFSFNQKNANKFIVGYVGLPSVQEGDRQTR